MLYVVYLKEHTYEATMMGAFLMKTDAQDFIDNHLLKAKLDLKEVENVWNHWTEIRTKTMEKVA